jgi:transglutaminase-like putative cysteine protease
VSGRAGPAPRTGTVARWSLHVALVAALGAFVVARDDRTALVLLVPLALAPALRWRRAPRALVVLLPAILRLALVGTLAVAVLSRQLRFVNEELGLRHGGILGWTLGVLAVLFMLGHRIWPVSTTLLPATVGVFVAAGLKPGIGFFPYFAAVGAVALWAFAFVHGGPRRLGLPLAAFLATAALLAAGTVWLLPWAQPHVERAIARALPGATTGLSGESRLGEFGRLAVSDRVVLRVWTSRPALLRAYVFTTFDGREWSSGERRESRSEKPILPWAGETSGTRLTGVSGSLFVIPGDGEPPFTGAGLAETRILQSVVADWPLLVPASPRLVRAPTTYLLRSREGELRWPPYEPARLYAVLHDAEGRADRAADEGGSARASALALPGRIDPRLRVLAGALATDARFDRARLENTVAWLGSNLTYRLDVGEFRTRDPLAEFLFEKKGGYCEYFATAAAVLLRLQGIPSRYVKGFAVGPENLVEGGFGVAAHHLVREADAHAWVEAWIEGEGWVEADPTPPGGLAAGRRPKPGWLERLVEAVRVHAARLRARVADEGLSGLLSLAEASAVALVDGLARHPRTSGLVVALLLAVPSWRRLRAWWIRIRAAQRARRERRAAVPGELGVLLARVERHWARRGRPRPPARGLREHLEGLPSDVLAPPEREASAEVVDACYRAAYGGALPPAAQMERLQREVARLGPS